MKLSRLAGNRGYWLAIVTAVVIALPTLGFGFFVDDYLFIATLEGSPIVGSPFDLYSFGTGNPEEIEPLIQNGPYPWFGDPYFKVHFFRPLTCALMAMDYNLFGHFSPAYNAHSILWYMLLCFGAMLIFRRTLPPAVGVLALFLFVADESHVLPVAWWANRHSIIAVGMGFLGVAAHLRWREENWRPGLPLSLVSYVLALLAAETGLCVLAYVLAYEIFGRREEWRRRFFAVLPVSLVAIGYLLLYRAGGFGAQFSDVYIDPVGDPIVFLLAAPARFVMLASAQFFMIPVEASLLHAEFEILFTVLGSLCLALVVGILYVLWPRFEEKEKNALRWLIPGAAMAAAPSLAAIVSSRVLLASSLGGAAIIATLIICLWRELHRSVSRPIRFLNKPVMLLIMGTILIGHLGIATLSWPGQVIALRSVMNHLDGLIRNSELDETQMAETQVVVFNPPEPYTGLYPLMLRSFDGLAAPRSWWTLSFAPYDHKLTRTGLQEMELEVVGGEMITSIAERLLRSSKRPLAVGYESKLNGLRIRVLEVGDTGPTRIGLLFEKNPESDCYQMLAFYDGAYRRLKLPGVGESIELPWGFR